MSVGLHAFKAFCHTHATHDVRSTAIMQQCSLSSSRQTWPGCAAWTTAAVSLPFLPAITWRSAKSVNVDRRSLLE